MDLAAVATAFGDLLHRAGVPMSADRLGRFIRASSITTPTTLDDLYWIGRVTLVGDRTHLAAYDAVFNQVFRGLHDWADTRGDGSAPPPTRAHPAPDRSRAATRPSANLDQGGPDLAAEAERQNEPTESEREIDVDVAVASREERLATTDFAALTDEELRALRALMQEIRLTAPLRPARRHHRHRHGDRLDLRATLRRSRRTGGDPIEHLTRRARRRPRKVVVLCDISGSMAPYSRACIQLLHAAAGGSHAEVFSFATRLTRLTRALSVADADAALALAAETAPDWKGGTRIGTALKEFLDAFGRRGLARGAVVVFVSDGWDRDDPGLIGEQMARLRRLAHRIVWINPRRAAPASSRWSAAWPRRCPHCDALVSGHTLDSLRAAMGAITDDVS
ncbi:MAG: vWA domain-containing protein [Acidimicrobiales bacterium]